MMQNKPSFLFASVLFCALFLTSCGSNTYGPLAQGGVAARAQGNYAVAEQKFEAALAQLNTKNPADNRYLAPALFNLGSAYFADNKANLSIAALERALNACEKYNKNDAGLQFDICEELAQAYQYANKDDLAEQMCRRTLKISEANFGKSDSATAVSLTHLGSLLKKEGKLQEALAAYLRAERIQDLSERYDPAGVSSLCNNLALLYEQLHQDDKAEALLKKAVRVDQEAEGASPYGRAVCLNNLAMFYARKGDLKTSETYYKKAIDVPLATSTNNRSVVAGIMMGYADLLKKLNRPGDAEKMVDKANKIGMSTGGVHPVSAK